VIIPGKFGNSVDLLVVTDIHRVRIGLVTAAGRVAVSQALRSRDPATAPAKPKITRGRCALSVRASPSRPSGTSSFRCC
jgi:adenine deaminase